MNVIHSTAFLCNPKTFALAPATFSPNFSAQVLFVAKLPIDLVEYTGGISHRTQVIV